VFWINNFLIFHCWDIKHFKWMQIIWHWFWWKMIKIALSNKYLFNRQHNFCRCNFLLLKKKKSIRLSNYWCYLALSWKHLVDLYLGQVSNWIQRDIFCYCCIFFNWL
jgi:hypothetical protein